MVDIVCFNLVVYLHSVAECFRNVCKQFVHFRLCFHPFLFGVKHSVRVGDIVVCGNTNQSVVSLGILFVYKVHVVCANEFYVTFASKFYQHGVYTFLIDNSFVICIRDGGFMSLKFKVIVFAKDAFVPSHLLFSFFYSAVEDKLWNFAAKASGTNDKSLGV